MCSNFFPRNLRGSIDTLPLDTPLIKIIVIFIESLQTFAYILPVGQSTPDKM